MVTLSLDRNVERERFKKTLACLMMVLVEVNFKMMACGDGVWREKAPAISDSRAKSHNFHAAI